MIEKLWWIFPKIKDDTLEYNRLWQYRPTIYWESGAILIGIGLFLIQFKGGRVPARETWSFHLKLVLFPWKWRFGQNHIYYDGPHCSYSFGPLGINLNWNSCQKCEK